MTIRDIIESLDNICVSADPDEPSDREAMISLRNIVRAEIEHVGKSEETMFLSPSSSSNDMKIFLSKDQEYGKIILQFEPSANAKWGFENLKDALELLDIFLSRLIDPSDIDQRRKELFQAEAARSIDNGSSKQILLSRLPWVSRLESSNMLQQITEPGLRMMSHKMACTASFRERLSQRNGTAYVIAISPMLYVIDRNKIDPIELMRLIALAKESE